MQVQELLITCVLFLCSVFANRTATVVNETAFVTIQNTLKKITDGYNKRIRPNIDGPPVKVVTSCYIVAVDQVNDVKSDFMVKMYFRQSWNDTRLAYRKKFPGLIKAKRIRVNGIMADEIWTPDTYVENEEGSSGEPFSSLKIVWYGLVQLSQKWAKKANCPTMNLQRFPHDSQSCFLVISSYAYTVNELVYKWRNRRPIEVRESPIASQYMLTDTITTVERQYYAGANGTWSYLKIEFVLKRKIAYYVIRIYLPAIIVTVTSWISFWIDPKAIPARLSLCVITVLAMTTLSYNSQSMVPSVPYVKAVDIYLIISFFFVFGTLLVYAFILNVSFRCPGKNNEQPPVEEIPLNGKQQNSGLTDIPVLPQRPSCSSCSSWTCDSYNAVGFPLAYFIFHVLYFILILT